MIKAATLVGVAAAVLAAQTQTPPPAFHIEANYVRVDAYPTRDGVLVADLTRNDFEIFEEQKPQTIEHFERVNVGGRRVTDEPADPGSLDNSREAVQNPRARVFVVFLDTNHVDPSGSHRVREPLVKALDELIGPDDLFAVMTPRMAPEMLTFARKTTTLANELDRRWDWGRRDNPGAKDSRELDCEASNPTAPALVEQAIARRRERETLTALTDLLSYLRSVREERKGVIAVTEGWVLFGPNPAIASLRNGCGSDVAYLEDGRAFQELIDVANHANASFYPIDPRGLPVFDAAITRPLTRGPGTPISGFPGATAPGVDSAQFASRREALQTLATSTDGLALLNSNDLAAAFKKIVDDLSSYYLLGYYSTGTLDGKFHTITVRVKQPGVQVRARRGYLASTSDDLRPAASASAAPISPSAAAVTAAIAALADYTRDVALRTQIAAVWSRADPPKLTVSVEGELSPAALPQNQPAAGATATVELAPVSGQPVATTRATLEPGSRAFRVSLTANDASGTYVVRVAVRPTESAAAIRQSREIAMPANRSTSGAQWWRRSPSTGNRPVLTADLRFRRNEHLKVEIPIGRAGVSGAARLLDRNGNALRIPVPVTVREDPDGSAWMGAQLALAPLGVGDYVIEFSDGRDTTMAAFRVVP